MKQILRAITVHRPWGYAIARLDKRIVNQDLKCPLNPGDYLAIHNGAHWDAAAAIFVRELNSSELIDSPTPDIDPPQAIVAIAQFKRNIAKSDSEWFSGPWGWELENVQEIDPVDCPGQEGLWKVPEELLLKVRENYQAASTIEAIHKYGTCWQCGGTFDIPGWPNSHCPRCGWIATEPTQRAKALAEARR